MKINSFIKCIFLVGFILNLSCGIIKNGTSLISETNLEIPEMNLSILTSANSWTINDLTDKTKPIITKDGIINWDSEDTRIRTYFKISRTGKINIGLKTRTIKGKSTLKVTFNGNSKNVNILNNEFEDVFVGTFLVDTPGYYFVEFQGVSKEGTSFADISNVLIGGEATNGILTYVKDDIYWGRRGPSVHLSYESPEKAGDVIYFYNEVTVPEGEDIVGSYFMANGFNEGYFGMQVNSSTERRFLFSVWSPFKTDNPKSIPEDQKIILLSKGENVNTGEFGNEGSGGQSFRRYFWKAGKTYKFLLKGIPSINNATDFTAYVFAPEIGKWELIASFRRPKTNTYLTRPHSFLENFIPETGNVSRKAFYSNQWIYDTSGIWHEMTIAKFTADATARKGSRLDYSGGSEYDKFYLENCGFFSDKTTIDSQIIRMPNEINPEIDFNTLPR